MPADAPGISADLVARLVETAGRDGPARSSSLSTKADAVIHWYYPGTLLADPGFTGRRGCECARRSAARTRLSR